MERKKYRGCRERRGLVSGLGKDRLKLAEPLSRQTTFRIGGPADLFYEAQTIGELIKAVELARKFGVAYFILGGGSNILVSDRGFRGLVIKVRSLKFEVQGERIVADAGVPLAELVEAAAKSSLSGLEFAVGIPGTVGGAIYGNAGSSKAAESLGERVESATLLMADGSVEEVDRDWLEFDYRESRLKRCSAAKRPLVLSAVLRLEKAEREKIEKAVAKRLAWRRERQPLGPSAGCVFKNPPDSSAGLLIDKAGLKGFKMGKAQISPKHANFIVNLGGAKAADVWELIKLGKKRVKEKFGIELVEEIQLVGDVGDEKRSDRVS